MVMIVAQWLEVHPGHTVVVEESDSLETMLQKLNSHSDVQDIYVTDNNGRVVGHISRLRIASLVLAKHRPHIGRRHLMERVAAGTARELMSRHFPTARADEDLDTVIHRQLEHKLHDMAVLDDEGRLVGTISLTILMKSFT